MAPQAAATVPSPDSRADPEKPLGPPASAWPPSRPSAGLCFRLRRCGFCPLYNMQWAAWGRREWSAEEMRCPVMERGKLGRKVLGSREGNQRVNPLGDRGVRVADSRGEGMRESGGKVKSGCRRFGAKV